MTTGSDAGKAPPRRKDPLVVNNQSTTSRREVEAGDEVSAPAPPVQPKTKPTARQIRGLPPALYEHEVARSLSATGKCYGSCSLTSCGP